MTRRAVVRWLGAVLLAALAATGLWLALRGRGGPAVPDPPLQAMEPQVAELLRGAREALLGHQDSGEAWGQLAALYDAHGLLDAAETCYRRARQLEPGDFRWAYLLAVAREIHGAEAPELVELFGEATRLRPDYAQAYLRLADALARRGLHDKAREPFELAIALAPGTAAAHRGLGQVRLQLGDVQGAVESLTRAAELEPRDRATQVALGQAYSRLGDDERSARAAELAEKLEPINTIDDPVWGQLVFERSVSSSRVFRRALSRFQAGDFAAAAADLELVLQARPDDASVHYWLGTARQRLGEIEPATTHLARAVELEPTMVPARSELAQLYFTTERFAEAAEQYLEALPRATNRAPLWLSLAEVRMRQGDLAGIVEAYTKAAELRPLDAREQLNFGVALMRNGKPKEALEHYRESLRLRPGSANTHYNMGVAYDLLGDAQAARAQFAEASRIDPGHAAALRLTEKN